ncbi:MAG: DegV family protein [Solirubrobacterales bacterium]
MRPEPPTDARAADRAESTRPVAVITDTTTYMPASLIAELGVQQVSLYVGWDGELKREDEYEDLAAFYQRLAESPSLPTTSQPSVGDFKACFRPILSEGHDIVSIHIAGGISGTCDSARSAAEELGKDGVEGRIEVIDGQTGAAGLGCLVIAAAEEAQRGASIEAVTAAVAAAQEHLDIYFCLDTLEYLRRGGRIGAAQALLGTALQIKPILTFATEITPVGRVRTHAKALQRMESYLVELHERGATDWVVQHAQAPDDAQRLVERGTAIFDSQPLFCTQVGPVLGAHLGSGMLVGGMTRA